MRSQVAYRGRGRALTTTIIISDSPLHSVWPQVALRRQLAGFFRHQRGAIFAAGEFGYMIVGLERPEPRCARARGNSAALEAVLLPVYDAFVYTPSEAGVWGSVGGGGP